MDNKIYYSDGVPRILEEKDRLRIASQILGVLKAHLPKLDNLYCLDVGCSGGVITNELSKYFKDVVGVDVDKRAIIQAQEKFKRKNLQFKHESAEGLEFKDETFDVVICNQVYNFVDSPKKLMDEIYRVLKPDGICFFSARNKLSLIEPQYGLPLLSMLPYRLAEKYLQILKKEKVFFGKNYMYYTELKRLVSKFRKIDYTTEILKNPEKYNFSSLKRYAKVARLLPLSQMVFLFPNFIWILTKRKNIA